MLHDIKKLILTYAIEPVYWFPKWIENFNSREHKRGFRINREYYSDSDIESIDGLITNIGPPLEYFLNHEIKSDDQTNDQPNDQTNDQTTDQPYDQTNDQTTDQPNDQTTDQPNDQTTDNDTDNLGSEICSINLDANPDTDDIKLDGHLMNWDEDQNELNEFFGIHDNIESYEPNIKRETDDIEQAYKTGGFFKDPSYKVPHKYKWENMSSDITIPLIESMESKSRAARYILDLIDNGNKKLRETSLLRITENPSEIILKYLKSSANYHITDSLYAYGLAHNKTSNPEFRKYIEDNINQELIQLIENSDESERHDIISLANSLGEISELIKNELRKELSKEHAIRLETPDEQNHEDMFKFYFNKLSRSHNNTILELLKEFPTLIHYPTLNINPHPEALKILNANPEKISNLIWTNPNPIIIKMLDARLNNKIFIPDPAYKNLCDKLETIDLPGIELLFNPGAVDLVENRLGYLCYLFEKKKRIYSDKKLPDTITPKIVDYLIFLVRGYEYIPEQILRCNSRELIRLYSECSFCMRYRNLETIATSNDYILSDNKYGNRFIDKVSEILDF